MNKIFRLEMPKISTFYCDIQKKPPNFLSGFAPELGLEPRTL